ncbi:ribosomal protein S2 [Melioribacter roseus P3M-2]|uniref:Small ribosomal subunit protein uS2 n=1 Tax=Melioribacter roseus (strain DSM 23840 / JCM 17771 / VKM B-2668 / P3M-2) TaxID=1191523 RepID=I6Z6Z3_MELRP|nr:30S ribosomal protein S2 [Melioribacter roseus]AFN74920.1 ribosomal protein S2 [Melioribacter roseus P3M-2]
MSKIGLTDLIEAGAHFGHLTRRWNPKMKPYIFMEKNGIHIIDLKKTQEAIEQAKQAMLDLVSQGKRVLFVGTKKQAKGIIAEEAKRCEANWVSERWLGGMLTNFATIRKSVKRLQNIDKMESDGTFEKITKKERLKLSRERDKLRKVLDGVETMTRLPGALFVVDVKKEDIAVKEANRLNIPVFAIVDTNCDPDPIDYVIPANDDASRAIEIITKAIADAVIEGNAKAKELKAQEAAEKEREKKVTETEEEKDEKPKKPRIRKVKFDNKNEKKSDTVQASDTQKEDEAKEEKSEESSNEETEN